ncbi:hypothetical protein [Luteimonas vadosa]|uniref:hypothetical protein n=1 Tax=Luteimonas vadosa TaxID=1165507 RepID=UPI0031EC1908
MRFFFGEFISLVDAKKYPRANVHPEPANPVASMPGVVDRAGREQVSSLLPSALRRGSLDSCWALTPGVFGEQRATMRAAGPAHVGDACLHRGNAREVAVRC